MKGYDERLHYYLTLARLLAEAELQLEADAEDAGSASYAEGLENLRDAIEDALAAAVEVGAQVQAVRAQALRTYTADPERPAKH